MIYIPKICGTCNGAKRAVDLAYSLSESGEKVVIYKDILHNSRVISDLEKNGVKCISNIEDIPCDGKTSVIIRAHGEGKKTYDYFSSHNIKVYDATCPNVVRIHDIVNDRYNKGYSIIIIGKKNHPEVIGSSGWCNNEAYLIESIDDVLFIDKLNDNTLIICQTTISMEMFDELSKKIISSKRSNFEVINTVCLAQKNIQNSSVELAKKVDYVFVIGGEKSSNTRELYNICSQYCKSFIFSNIKDFFDFIKKEKNINMKSKICITGGASTPIYLIEEYKNLLEFYLFYKEKIKIYDCNIEKLNLSFVNNAENKYVVDAIKKFISLNSGGKYVRAFLINLGYEMFGKKKDYSLDLALAYEFFQTSILIHDDIIDNANLRRGKKTVPVLYGEDFERFSGYKKELDSLKKHISNSLALCVGDLGYYYANQIILDKYSKDKNLSSVLKYYNNIVINTIKGEIIDVILPFLEQMKNCTVVLDDILQILELKTSWYSVVGPFCLGMTLAGVDSNIIERFEKILLPVGIAFQIKDDILGIYSDNLVVGKDSSDISEFKQTVLYSYAIKNAKYKDELIKYYGKKDLSMTDVENVRRIFDLSGAKDFAINMMKEFFDKAKKEIGVLNIDNKFKDILLGFVLYLELREK